MDNKTLSIIIKAIDNASNVIKQVKDNTKKSFSDMNKSISSTTKSMSEATGKAAKALAPVSIGLFALGGKMIDLAASAEEMEAKFSNVFKTMTDENEKWAVSFAKNVGRGKNEVKGYMANIMALANGFGATTEEGAKLTQQVVTLGVDLASFHDKNDADAIRAVTSALTGEYESMKSLGVVINETILARQMEREGLTGKFQDLSQLQQMQVRYNAILQQSADAEGDAVRNRDSYTSSLKGFLGALKDEGAELGKTLLPVMKDILQYLTELLKGFSSLPDGVKEAIVKIGTTVALLAPLLTFLSGFLGIISKVAGLLGKIGIGAAAGGAAGGATAAAGGATATTGALTKLLGVLAKAGGSIVSLFAKIGPLLASAGAAIAKIGAAIAGALGGISAGTVALIAAVIAIVAGLIYVIVKYWDEIKAFFIKLFDQIKQGISYIPQIVKMAFDSVVNFMKELATKTKETIDNIKQFFINLFENVRQGFLNVINGITAPFKAIINMITGGINKLTSGLNNIKIKMPDWLPLIGGKTLGFNIPQIPQLATGTNYVPKDMLAYIHKGEAVVPAKYNNGSQNSGAGRMILNLNIGGKTLANELIPIIAGEVDARIN